MPGQDQTVILRVQLDEADSEKRLGEITVAVIENRKAQQELKKAYDANKISAAEYGQQSVKLNSELRMQQTEQRNLTKNLDLYRAAQNGQVDSYKATQAALSLAIRQQQELAGSADNSSEASQALTKQIEQYRATLKATDEQQGAFFRNIGNYPKGENLESLVRQLVKLQEETKGLAAGTEEASRAQMRIIGFQTQAAQAGAKEGKSYEETTNFIEQYGEAIRPATQALVQLTQQQQAAAESGEATGETMAQIGFKIGAAESQIKKATDVLKAEASAADKAAKENKSLGAGLKEVAGQNSLVAGATEKYSAAKEKFTQVSNLAKLAIGGEVTALGLLRLAIIATGVGALVVLLGSLVVFLTKTTEGTQLVSNVMAQVGAVVNVVIDRLGSLGKAVTQVLSGDFSGAAATAKAAFAGIGDEMVREAKLAGDLSKAQQQLDRDRQANAATNKKLLRDEENLKNIRDDESKSLAVRRKANEDAFAIEQKREAILVDMAKRQLAINQQEVEMRGGRAKADKELLDKLAEAEAELADIQEDAAGRRNEYITNRNSLLKDSADKEKEQAEKTAERTIQLRKDALALEAVLIDRQLRQTQANSDQELNLLQQKLRNQYQAELNVKNLTISAKKVLDAKYESDSQQLLVTAIKARALAAYDAEAASINRELALVKSGTDEETELRREAIRTQLAAQKAALDVRKDNAQQIALLDANAAKAINDVDYGAALAKLDRFLQASRNALDESFAAGRITEQQYADATLVADQAAAGARLQLARDFKQDTVQLEQQAAAAKIVALKKVGDAERAEQAKRMDQAQALASGLASLFAEYAAMQGATLVDFARKSLVLLIDSLERSVIAAQIEIIANSFKTPDSIASFGITGLARSAAIIGLVIAATEGLKAQLTPSSSQFAQGTVLGGASHAHGGVQLYSRTGYHFGEAEKDEIILTKGVFQSPVLRPIASMLNVMGGGRPLVPNMATPHMALGGVTYPALAQQQLQGNAGQGIDYDRLAQAMSKYPIYTRTQETMKSIEKVRQTQALSSD